MASISKVGRKFSIRFRYMGTQYRVTVESESKAESVRLVIENTLTDLELGRLSLPVGTDVAKFIASGGKTPALSPPTLSNLIERWESQRNAAETTQRVDCVRCGHLKRHLGAQRIDSLTIEKYIKRRSRKVSRKTIKKELVTLSTVLNFAQTLGYAVPGPILSQCRLPLSDQHRPFTSLSEATDGRCVLLNSEEVGKLRGTVRKNGSELIADAVDFISFTGVRRSELCRIQPADVQLPNKSITIREKKRKHGSITFRTLPIHSEILPLLQRRLKMGREFLFTNSVHTLTSGFQEAVKGTAFDLKGFGFHVLRHSVASQLLAKGIPPVTVAALLGHASVSTTLQIYAHAFDTETRKAVDLL